MNTCTRYLAAAAAIGSLSAPLAAQNAYGYQQPYQQAYPQQAYPQQSYPSYGEQRDRYDQGAQNPVGQIINQLLGNRYNVTDRQAVSQCASAAMAQAAAQYGNGYNRQGYNRYHRDGYNGYNGQGHDGYNRGGAMRVTAITDVRRRSDGLRVSGLMSSGGGYGGQNGYQDRNYANGYQDRNYANGDVSFRCNVDYRGAVTNVRIGHNHGYRAY